MLATMLLYWLQPYYQVSYCYKYSERMCICRLVHMIVRTAGSLLYRSADVERLRLVVLWRGRPYFRRQFSQLDPWWFWTWYGVLQSSPVGFRAFFGKIPYT